MAVKTRKRILTIILYLLFFFFIIIAFTKKVNVNVDEVFSYGLSNHYGGKSLSFEDGVKYIPANTPWMDYVTVSKDHRFDYRNVWNNQAKDVHPPFYYAILHTLCSFIPGEFTFWTGLAVNLVFCLLSLWIIGKITEIYSDNFWIKIVIQLLFVAVPAFYGVAVFIRMYTMTVFCSLLFLFFFIRCVRGRTDVWNYVELLLSAILGALTHYYCMIFIVLLSVAYGVYCLFSRKFKILLRYALTMGLAAVGSLMIFPGMIKHFLYSDRGQQTIDNAGSILTLYKNLWQDVQLITSQLFGSWACVIAILAVTIALLLYGMKRKENKTIDVEFVMLWAAQIVYIVLVAATAPYATDRYFFPIYGCLFVSVFIPLARAILAIDEGVRAIVVLLIIAVTIPAIAWHGFQWQYLDSFTRESLEWAAEHSDLECILIHGKTYRMHTFFLEVSNYSACTPVSMKDLELLPSEEEYKGRDFVLTLAGIEDEDNYLSIVMEKYPGHNYSQVAYSAYSHSYYFEATE